MLFRMTIPPSVLTDISRFMEQGYRIWRTACGLLPLLVKGRSGTAPHRRCAQAGMEEGDIAPC
jgi:hypothetical protein